MMGESLRPSFMLFTGVKSVGHNPFQANKDAEGNTVSHRLYIAWVQAGDDSQEVILPCPSPFNWNVHWTSCSSPYLLLRIFSKRILPCPGKGLRAFWTWISNFPKHLRCPRAKSYPPSLMSNSPDPEIHWGISHSLLLTDSGCRKPQPIGGQIQP